VEFPGGDSLVAMQVTELGTMSRGGSIVWRVALQKLNERGPIRARYLTQFDSRVNAKVNQRGTVVMAEPTPAADGQSLRYSGLLTLEPLHLPLGPTDAVIVGIACDTPGQRVRITQFVMSQYPRP
jgi:hypothetical protein